MTTKDEIEELVKAKKSNPAIKYPLTYIWGFKDPYNERLVGKFNFQLGQQRVESFIRKFNIRKSTNLNIESKIDEDY